MSIDWRRHTWALPVPHKGEQLMEDFICRTEVAALFYSWGNKTKPSVLMIFWTDYLLYVTSCYPSPVSRQSSDVNIKIKAKIETN